MKDKLKKIRSKRFNDKIQKNREDILLNLEKIKTFEGENYFDMNYMKNLLSKK